MSCYQMAGLNLSINIASRSFEDVAKFKYLRSDKNCMHEEIKSRLNLGNTATIQSRVVCLPAWSLEM
jgi:hypothetical protein